ncbi:unnamed protein product [Candida verbasci]|uniref:Uncharacterized protein n=1 Tax=Candida verbasci TaxID=1227364 RepID=A0A9W4U0S0_9ASCO|nr:unnamed protein product [Candida verbasci]
MSSIRKSTRTRTPTPKASTNLKTEEPSQKKRKLSIEEEEKLISFDKIDPVEKLLSLTNINYDFLSDLESETEVEEIYEEEPIQIASVNFTQILQDNIRQYYLKKLQNSQYKDSFALLNRKEEEVITKEAAKLPTTSEVPFFKNVNFSNNKKEYSIEDYFSYGEDEEKETEATTSEPESPISSPIASSTSLYIPKINNRYTNSGYKYQDVSRILNKNCIITGKASEMVSTGNFMINDFYL